MKHYYGILFSLISLFSVLNAAGQTPRNMVRIQEENDFFNLIGNRTDRSYTNGTRIDFLKLSPTRKRSSLYRILPNLGDSSIHIRGWSVAQLMVTPGDITRKEYQPNDYPYAGALFFTRSIHSYNPVKKASYQAEFLVGLRGPRAKAGPTQTAIHQLIKSAKPLGWENELNTQLLVNLTLTAERNLVSWGDFVEVNGGIQTRVGSLMDAVLAYPFIRIGKMSPYFEGPLSSRSASHRGRSQFQCYFFFKPTASFVAYNAMLMGTPLTVEKGNYVNESSLTIAHFVREVQMGTVVGYGKLQVSYLLTRSSAYDKGLYEHRYGTISLCVRW